MRRRVTEDSVPLNGTAPSCNLTREIAMASNNYTVSTKKRPPLSMFKGFKCTLLGPHVRLNEGDILWPQIYVYDSVSRIDGASFCCSVQLLQRAPQCSPQCSHCKRCTSYSNSVRLSVCLSHAGIVSKRRHVARCCLHCQIAKCV